MKPKELLIEAVNKFYERKAQKEGIYVLRFTIEIYEKAKEIGRASCRERV